MTILVADDDNDDLQFFCDAVAEIDPHINCTTASNGIEALQLLESAETRPDFIFLDLNMPKMNGKQCLKHIKNNPIFQSIPVVIYSTSRRPEDIEEAYQAGASAFIKKPNKFHLLKEEISSAIQNGSTFHV
ncbi:MAG TPA: response regulator [Puia sp.]